jgi:hypothetical protein
MEAGPPLIFGALDMKAYRINAELDREEARPIRVQGVYAGRLRGSSQNISEMSLASCESMLKTMRECRRALAITVYPHVRARAFSKKEVEAWASSCFAGDLSAVGRPWRRGSSSSSTIAVRAKTKSI